MALEEAIAGAVGAIPVGKLSISTLENIENLNELRVFRQVLNTCTVQYPLTTTTPVGASYALKLPINMLESVEPRGKLLMSEYDEYDDFSLATPLVTSLPKNANPAEANANPAEANARVLKHPNEEISYSEPEVLSISTALAQPFDAAHDIQARYLALSEEFASLTSTQQRTKAEIDAIYAEIDARIQPLKDKLVSIHEEIYSTRIELNRSRRELETALRILKIEIQKYQQQAQYINNAIEFDRITAGLSWREFVLPHQLEGAKILASQKRALLGDKPGLGKTLTSLIYCDMLRSKRVLVVVPGDVLRNYEREIEHWAPHRTISPVGKMPKAMRSFALELVNQLDQFIVTVNYEAWRKDQSLIEDLIKLRFDTVICDEAHVMKKSSTSAARGVTQIVHATNSCPRCSGPVGDELIENTTNRFREACSQCSWTSTSDRDYLITDKRSVKNVLPMTGTFILNKPQDIFPSLHLIDDELFPTERAFLNMFCEQDYYTGHWGFRPGGMESLSIKLGSRIVMRDRSSAGVTLPKQSITIHEMEFNETEYPLQAKIMKMVRENSQIVLDSGKSLPIIAQIAMITRQRQAAVFPAGIELKDPVSNEVVFSVGEEVQESMKIDRALELIEEHEGEKVVVFSQFKRPLDFMAEQLRAKGLSVGVYHGGTSREERDAIQLDFDRRTTDSPNTTQHYDVILCNYKTGGVGLNFTAATAMIILDEEWNPGKRDQAYMRLDRMGQTEQTTVDVLRISKSIDTWMAGLIDEKEAMVSGFETETGLRTALLQAIQNGEV